MRRYDPFISPIFRDQIIAPSDIPHLISVAKNVKTLSYTFNENEIRVLTLLPQFPTAKRFPGTDLLRYLKRLLSIEDDIFIIP
jgi:hypothetical protein